MRGETGALSPTAQRGLRLFESVGCVSFHSGPAFAGPELPPGQGVFRKFPLYADNELVRKYGLGADPGRFAVTGDEQDRGVWRVAPLRGIAQTAPYFHNGAVATLEEAVRVTAKTELDRELDEEETRAITEFLRSLTGRFPRQEFPRLPGF